jgi:hypothetical protein
MPRNGRLLLLLRTSPAGEKEMLNTVWTLAQPAVGRNLKYEIEGRIIGSLDHTWKDCYETEMGYGCMDVKTIIRR